MNKGNKNKWWLNGGRDSGRTIRLLCEVYENKIAELQHKVDTLQGFLDHDIEYDMYKTIQGLRNENAELKSELSKKAVTNHSLVEQMADLKSENAELKEQYVCYVVTNYNKQLTKAKELLKEAQGYIENIDDEGDELYDEIEQFIKEIEK